MGSAAEEVWSRFAHPVPQKARKKDVAMGEVSWRRMWNSSANLCGLGAEVVSEGKWRGRHVIAAAEENLLISKALRRVTLF